MIVITRNCAGMPVAWGRREYGLLTDVLMSDKKTQTIFYHCLPDDEKGIKGHPETLVLSNTSITRNMLEEILGHGDFEYKLVAEEELAKEVPFPINKVELSNAA